MYVNNLDKFHEYVIQEIECYVVLCTITKSVEIQWDLQ
jgi:hypothetical protein